MKGNPPWAELQVLNLVVHFWGKTWPNVIYWFTSMTSSLIEGSEMEKM
jgi:hypothetical protein